MFIKRLFRLGLLLLPFAMVQNLFAAETPAFTELLLFQEIPQVSVSSFTEKENVLTSVSTVSVIDKAMIERYHFATISEAVETVAGFSVLRTYLKSGLATSRGILQENFANKVLIMINNVPTWNAVTGEGELDRVDITDVERIEVLKGPASVLYGSNAYTGAVNIVLKKSEKQAAEIIGGVGSGHGGYSQVGSYRSGGLYTTTNDGLSLMLAANASNNTGEDFTFKDEGTATVPRHSDHLADYSNSRDFTLNAGYLQHSLLVNVASHDELFYGNNMTIATGLGKDQLVEGILTSYAFDDTWEKLKAKYSLTYDYNRRNFSRSSDDDTHSEISGSRFVNLLDLSYPVLDKLNLELGATHEIRTSNAYNTYLVLENQVISENNMGQKSSREWSGFAQADYTWEILKLLVGTRYTENQQFGSDLSSRGTLICGLNESNSIKLIAGQSFRAPSFFETDFVSPLPLTVFGNPNLKPEKSNSIELAYLTNFKTGEIGTFFAQVLGYYATYDNDITRVRGTVVYQGKTYTNVNVYQNADKFSAKGVELELKYAMADTQVFLNGDCVLGDDADKVYETLTQQYTYNFKYDPKYTLSGGLTQNFGPFYLSGNANYYASKNGPFYGIPASYDLAAAVGYKTAATDNYISVKNVTDQDVDFPEYVRRTVVNGVPQVNAIPQVNGRSIFYNFEIHF